MLCVQINRNEKLHDRLLASDQDKCSPNVWSFSAVCVYFDSCKHTRIHFGDNNLTGIGFVL